jgi:uncharacterized protein YjbI with pentapeptide repeats
VKQDPTPRTRSFIRELVPDWQLTREQVLWVSRTAVAVVLALTLVGLLGAALWVVLSIYINPQNATERKDLVQSFAIVVAGMVGSLSALAAVGNLYVSRRNLQQERELELERAKRERDLEEQRAQEDALPEYLDQMVQLLSDKDRPLRRSKAGDEVSILARVRTLTVLPRLDGGRKGSVVQFLYESGLITKDRRVVDLSKADLSYADLYGANLSYANLHGGYLIKTNLIKADLVEADLSGAYLIEADLIRADLSGANLSNAWLRHANLSGADLSGSNLSGSNFSGADLRGADVSRAVPRYANLSRTDLSGSNLSGADLHGTDLQGADLSSASGITNEELMRQTFRLEGATMPNCQTYEEWLKSEGRGEDGNSGPA